MFGFNLLEKKSKGSLDDSNLRIDEADIPYEEQFDSSLDETEDLLNVHLSPRSGFDVDHTSKGIIVFL